MENVSLINKAIPNQWLGNCFGCSQKNQDGLQLQVHLSEDRCYSNTIVSEKFCGFDGIVHGGIIATLLDEISAWTLVVHISKLCVTQETKLRYYYPVATNKPITVEAKIINQTENNALTRSFIKNMDGKILAESESKWFIPDFKTLAKLTGKDESSIREMYNRFMIPIEKLKREKIKN
jgi:uncharacterized protein (TIGR00369 family)